MVKVNAYISEAGNVVGAIPHKSILKHKYDIVAPTAIQKIYRVFGFLNYQN